MPLSRVEVSPHVGSRRCPQRRSCSRQSGTRPRPSTAVNGADVDLGGLAIGIFDAICSPKDLRLLIPASILLRTWSPDHFFQIARTWRRGARRMPFRAKAEGQSFSRDGRSHEWDDRHASARPDRRMALPFVAGGASGARNCPSRRNRSEPDGRRRIRWQLGGDGGDLLIRADLLQEFRQHPSPVRPDRWRSPARHRRHCRRRPRPPGSPTVVGETVHRTVSRSSSISSMPRWRLHHERAAPPVRAAPREITPR